MSMRTYLLATTIVVSIAACSPLSGRGPGPGAPGKADTTETETETEASLAREQATAQAMQALIGEPEALLSFLQQMPKGADLHSHLTGAASIEAIIGWGAEDGFCLEPDFGVSQGPCDDDGDAIALSTVEPGSDLYRQIVAAWSMEGQADSPLAERHQHFFDTFFRFGPITWKRTGEMLADVMTRAAAHNVQQVELMVGLRATSAGKIGERLIEPGGPWDDDTLEGERAEILADDKLVSALRASRYNLDQWEARAREVMQCDDPDNADPGCAVNVRYLVQANRTKSREAVFAQFVYGFEMVQQDERVVGVNLAYAEEHPSSLAHYDDEMRALDLLQRLHQADADARPVHVALHAGELIADLLPDTPEGQAHLGAHIRKAVEIGRAERIGHGVDVGADAEAELLLQQMAASGVLIELCLSSNDALLGIHGSAHPLASYLAAGVAAAIATDDEGVLRTSLSQEFVRAVQEHGLDYATLKQLARASVQHAFLSGASLRSEASCIASLSDEVLTPPCAAFIGQSERAAAQWQLEASLDAFERSILDDVD